MDLLPISIFRKMVILPQIEKAELADQLVGRYNPEFIFGPFFSGADRRLLDNIPYG